MNLIDCRVFQVTIPVSWRTSGTIEESRLLSCGSRMYYKPDLEDFLSGVKLGADPVFLVLTTSKEAPEKGKYVYCFDSKQVGRVQEIMDDGSLIVQLLDGAYKEVSRQTCMKVLGSNTSMIPAHKIPPVFLRDYAEANGKISRLQLVQGVTVNQTLIIGHPELV